MADKQPTLVEEISTPPCPPRPSETKLDSPRCMYHEETLDLQTDSGCCSSERIAESDKEQYQHQQDSIEAATLPALVDIPDGGTAAWLVVLGAWCVSFCSYGWINSEFNSNTNVQMTP